MLLAEAAEHFNTTWRRPLADAKVATASINVRGPNGLRSTRASALWRHYRREVTHCELFGSIDALLEATHEFFERMNRTPERTLSIIGAHPA